MKNMYTVIMTMKNMYTVIMTKKIIYTIIMTMINVYTVIMAIKNVLQIFYRKLKLIKFVNKTNIGIICGALEKKTNHALHKLAYRIVDACVWTVSENNARLMTLFDNLKICHIGLYRFA